MHNNYNKNARMFLTYWVDISTRGVAGTLNKHYYIQEKIDSTTDYLYHILTWVVILKHKANLITIGPAITELWV